MVTSSLNPSDFDIENFTLLDLVSFKNIKRSFIQYLRKIFRETYICYSWYANMRMGQRIRGLEMKDFC